MDSAHKKLTEVDTEPTMPYIDIYLQMVIRVNESIYKISSGDGSEISIFEQISHLIGKNPKV